MYLLSVFEALSTQGVSFSGDISSSRKLFEKPCFRSLVNQQSASSEKTC